MKTLRLKLIVTLWLYNVVSFGTIGDIWNAALDFNSTNNPNGPWSYLDYTTGALMVANSGLHGYPPGWNSPLAGQTYMSIAPNQGSVPDIDSTGRSIAGHGHALIRWTSPINGWVSISGVLFMRSDAIPERVHWFILEQNNIEFSRASVKLSAPGQAILGPDGKVLFSEGYGETSALIRAISIGDTLDLNIVNIGGPGHFYIAEFEIKKLHDWPTWPVCGDANHPYPAGDINKDCKVDIFDLTVLAMNWVEDTNP